MRRGTCCAWKASGQQRRFGDFVHWMNLDRGHEALGMRCPGDVYVASPREWQPRPAEPEYPGHWGCAACVAPAR